MVMKMGILLSANTQLQRGCKKKAHKSILLVGDFELSQWAKLTEKAVCRSVLQYGTVI